MQGFVGFSHCFPIQPVENERSENNPSDYPVACKNLVYFIALYYSGGGN